MEAGDIRVLATRLGDLHEDVTEIKGAMKTLSEAITKLALVEDRQANTAEALERAFKAIERVELRLTKLELEGPAHNRAAALIDKALIGAVIIVALYVSKKVGLS